MSDERRSSDLATLGGRGSSSRGVRARADGLRFTYGGAGAPALDGVDLELRAGELVLLEGPSGGGKSTLLRALCGLVPHFHGGRFAGRVTVDGLDTRHVAPARVARRAGLLFQEPEAQAVMGTVDRDVAFGAACAGAPPGAIPGRVAGALAAAGAGHLAGRRMGELSGGERQRVALAGVLALRPGVLLLDEPTSQLDPDAADALAVTLRRLAEEEGVAVLVAEHRGERMGRVADRVLAVTDGRLASPAPAAVLGAPLGAGPGPVAARLDGLHAGHPGRPVLRGVSLALAGGTVTALCGPNGGGKTTLLRVLAGLHAPEAGAVELGGRDVTAVPAAQRFPAVGLVGQEPGRHLLAERVGDEVAFALRVAGVPAPAREARVRAALAAHGLTGLRARHPLDLSAGQRERLAQAAVMVAEPAVLALDEPTRGLDPARKAALADLVRDRARAGGAVVLATHDIAFAAAVADRVLIVRDGLLEPVIPAEAGAEALTEATP